MTLNQSNNEARQRRTFEVGDKVEHTNSHRIGAAQEIRPWRDGTFELRVHARTRHVVELEARQEPDRRGGDEA
jgi:hypothetical protein